MATGANGEDSVGRSRILVAGGGVAALEATLALQRLAGERLAITLIAPDPKFRHRPLSVAEPFGLSAPRALDLESFALEHGATFICDSLAAIAPAERRMSTGAGRELAYDELLIAIGARAGTTIPGALPFWDTADRGAFADVLSAIEEGRVRRVAFAVPREVAWPLGLYELALLTAHRVRELGLEGVELSFVTPEARPLAVFGAAASRVAAGLIDEAGIGLRLGATPLGFGNGELSLDSGEPIRCERVVSLPIPEVARIPGLPQDASGFIHTDRFGAVFELEHVYAAGDATAFPVKQGGLAAQQADCAARTIAAAVGADVAPWPFRPILRGALLTEWGPRFLRSALEEKTSTAARSVLWWPPAKLAGRYLAPYLAAEAGYGQGQVELADLEAPIGDRPQDAEDAHEDVLAVALGSADASARARDFRGALRWLEVAENLELYLPSGYESKRIAWQGLAAPRSARGQAPGPG